MREIESAHGIVGDISKKEDIHPTVIQILGALGGLDLLINNASDLGPTPLRLLADTDCEELERALAVNMMGPFRLTKALLGSLAASVWEGRPAAVVNISSDAAINVYPQWGAYGASKAGLHHMSRIWDAELASIGVRVRVLSIDPGDMDTPMHAAAVPDADRSILQRPEEAAKKLADTIAAALSSSVSGAPSRGGKTRGGKTRGGELIAAGAPVQRPLDAKLLVVGAGGDIAQRPRSEFAEVLDRGDVAIANDAATLPASLFGRHVRSGAAIEVRLAGRRSLRDVKHFSAVVFGAGDFHTRTEDRPRPPRLKPGDLLELGPLAATVTHVLDHPRHIALHIEGSPRQIWEGLARHGRPNSICACRDAACALGHMDGDRRPSRRFRAAVSRFRARLAHARIDGGARRPVWRDHSFGRNFIDRRRGAR